MGYKINLIVNYKNALGLWHLAAEQMTKTSQNYFIKPADFAKFIAESYMSRGCTEIICVEFKRNKITKSGLKCLAESDAKFITDAIKDDLGERWEFTKDETEKSEVND